MGQGGAWSFEKEGSVSFYDSSFSSNSALWGGAFSGGAFLTLLVNNTSFSSNTAVAAAAGTGSSSSNAHAGALECNSCDQVTLSYSTFTKNSAPSAGALSLNTVLSGSVTGCTFTSNSASTALDSVTLAGCSRSGGQGGGGAICVTINGNVTLSPTCTFNNNTASNGGAVWTKRTCDVTDRTCGALFMTGPIFTDNRALAGGGGAMWAYTASELSYSCPGSSAMLTGPALTTSCSGWSGNLGVYGNLVASTASSLVFNSNDPFNIVILNSSSAIIPRYLSSGKQSINMPISVSVVDAFGQNITAGSPECTSSLTALSDSSVWTLSGITTMSANAGTAQYSSLSLRAPPANYSVKISTSSTYHTLDPIYVTVTVRPCIIGEVTNDLNDQCTYCDGSTFSFWPRNTTCDVCPSSASCNPTPVNGSKSVMISNCP